MSSWFAVPLTLLDALDFCEQLVCCPTHIAHTSNRLNLLITDAHDIVDVFVGTPLVSSDHCLPVVCFWLINLYQSTISDVPSF